VHTSDTYSRFRRFLVDSEERIDLGGREDPFPVKPSKNVTLSEIVESSKK
jgi:hypothetical protein